MPCYSKFDKTMNFTLRKCNHKRSLTTKHWREELQGNFGLHPAQKLTTQNLKHLLFNSSRSDAFLRNIDTHMYLVHVQRATNLLSLGRFLFQQQSKQEEPNERQKSGYRRCYPRCSRHRLVLFCALLCRCCPRRRKIQRALHAALPAC